MDSSTPLNNAPRAAWIDALRSIAGVCGIQSADRWKARRESGLNDLELLATLGDEFGISGGASVIRKFLSVSELMEWNPDGSSSWAYGYHYDGGKNPRLCVTDEFCTAHMSHHLHGTELIALAREALEIPDKTGAFQRTLF